MHDRDRIGPPLKPRNPIMTLRWEAIRISLYTASLAHPVIRVYKAYVRSTIQKKQNKDKGWYETEWALIQILCYGAHDFPGWRDSPGNRMNCSERSLAVIHFGLCRQNTSSIQEEFGLMRRKSWDLHTSVISFRKLRLNRTDPLPLPVSLSHRPTHL